MNRLSSSPIIDLREVHFVYDGQRDGRPALDGISLAVEEGEFVGILGRSGAGKSSLCLTLAGLIPHFMDGEFEGKAVIAGLDTAETSVGRLSQQVAIVFQNPESQLYGLTVEEEVSFALENRGVPTEEIRNRVEWALEAVGMSDYLHKSPFDLSGGQKQRVVLASALALRPRILVLDEPTAELDPQGKDAIFDVVARLHRKGLTVVFVEHDVERLVEYANRLIVLDRGRIARDARPEELYQDIAFFETSGLPVPQVTVAAERLRKAGWSVSRIPVTLPDAVRVLGTRVSGTVTGSRHSEAAPRRGATASGRVDSWGQTQTVVAGAAAKGKPRTVLEARGISFTYPDGTVALRGIDLIIRAGEYLALVGRNGSGKTTLAKHLNGLLRPKTGQVLFAGKPTTSLSVAEVARHVGYVFQNPGHQIFNQTVADEVAFGLRCQGLRPPALQKRTEDAMALVGIQGLKERHPMFLTLAEKKLVAIASTLAVQPEVLILDEPTSSLDRVESERVLALLRALHASGRTIVLITHDMRLVAEEAERVVALDAGRVVFDGTPSALFGDPDVLARAYLKLPQVSELGRALLPSEPVILTVEGLVRALLGGEETSSN